MKIAVFHSLLVFQTRLLEIAFLGLVSCSMDRNSNSCGSDKNLDSGYPHDGRADKNPYPHDCCADKDSYPHDSNNQCIILRLQLSFAMINEQVMLV